MDREALRTYCLALPEKILRSASALAAGVARELGEVALPARLRRTRLYHNLVDSTLRFLVEQVGQVEGVFPEATPLERNFLLRRSAGNVIEAAGILAFRASPVWVLAALADLSGASRGLVAEIAAELEREGLVEPGGRFENADQLLDGLERTAGRLAESINTPPLDIAGLKREWAAMKEDARRIPAAALPSPALLWNQWRALQQEAAAQRRSVFALSSVMALSAVRRLPENALRLSRATRVSMRLTGEVLAQALLDHYRATLAEIRQTGYLRYWAREFRPYLAGAMRQLSPAQPSTTARLLAWRKSRRQSAP